MFKLPIGYDNFGELVKRKLSFIDKTLFIKELLDDETSAVTLITRPRRFGKTLNLSMLQYFFAAEAYGEKTTGLFDGLNISHTGEEYLQHQGKYPVIFITFKGVKDHQFEHAYEALKGLVTSLYSEHRYLLASDQFNSEDKERFHAYLRGKIERADVENSLLILSKYLFIYHGTKPWLLIDEYDTPIQAAYSHGYYENMIDIMRNLFGAALKTNPYLHRAVITGILRISKESLFSDLNNLGVYSILDDEYSSYFGFTEEEMQEVLQKAELEDKSEDVKKWYNGYQMGHTTVYNPWSIANFVNRKGKLSPYWINTSGNQLVKDLIIQSKDQFKSQIEDLLAGKPIECTINEDMVFGDLATHSEAAVWSLLLLSGYLKVLKHSMNNDRLVSTLDIPNYEVRTIYRQTVETWLTRDRGIQAYDNLLDYLLTGQMDLFAEHFALFMEQTASYHDFGHDPEAFYHGLLIGLTASLYGNTNYQITSNRESGFGRYDYLVFSQDLTKPTILFELKRIKKPKETTSEEELDELLKKGAHEAIHQIMTQNYLTEAKRLGATDILKIGLAFCGKKFWMENERM